jgi:hypothetical protein
MPLPVCFSPDSTTNQNLCLTFIGCFPNAGYFHFVINFFDQMNHKRRNFIKFTGLTGLGLAGGVVHGIGQIHTPDTKPPNPKPGSSAVTSSTATDGTATSIIGLYGPWANSPVTVGQTWNNGALPPGVS